MSDESLGYSRLYSGLRPAVIAATGRGAEGFRFDHLRGSVIYQATGAVVYGQIAAGLAAKLADQLPRAQSIVADEAIPVDEALGVASENAPAAAPVLQAIVEAYEEQTAAIEAQTAAIEEQTAAIEAQTAATEEQSKSLRDGAKRAWIVTLIAAIIPVASTAAELSVADPPPNQTSIIQQIEENHITTIEVIIERESEPKPDDPEAPKPKRPGKGQQPSGDR